MTATFDVMHEEWTSWIFCRIQLNKWKTAFQSSVFTLTVETETQKGKCVFCRTLYIYIYIYKYDSKSQYLCATIFFFLSLYTKTLLTEMFELWTERRTFGEKRVFLFSVATACLCLFSETVQGRRGLLFA